MLKVCFISMKGGTGKTTLSLLFSLYLANKGKKVLVVDMDPQGNATIALAENKVFDDNGFLKLGMPYIIEAFLLPKVSADRLRSSVLENTLEVSLHAGRVLYLIPNFLESHRYDLHLVSNHAVPVFVNELISCLDAEPDFVVMDCPPYMSSLSYAALFGADVIVIPAEASKFGIVGIELLLSVVEDVIRKRGNSYYNIVIQPNRIKNTKSCTFYLDVLRSRYKDFVALKHIKETVEVPRMIREGLPAFNSATSSTRESVIDAISALLEKVLKRE